MSLFAAVSAAALLGALAALAWLVVKKNVLGNLSPSQSGTRSAQLDNAKFFLVVGVTATHYIGLTGGDLPGTDMMRRFTMPFCLRMFAFCSGVVSRSPPSWKALGALSWRVVVPLVVWVSILDSFLFELPFEGTDTAFAGFFDRSWRKLVSPSGEIGEAWYLEALVLWRLLGFVLWPLKDRPGLRLTISVVVSSIVGFVAISYFSIGHALHSWPLFVAGQIFPWEAVTSRLQFSSLTALFGILVLVLMYMIEVIDRDDFRFIDSMPADQWLTNFQTDERINFGLMYSSGDHAFCNDGDMWVFWFRGLFRHAWELTKGLALMLCCCPQRQTFFTDWGRYSLYPYLNQLVLLRAIWPWARWPTVFVDNWSTWWAVGLSWVLFSVLVLAVIALLASWPVRPAFALFLEPEWLWRWCCSWKAFFNSCCSRLGWPREVLKSASRRSVDEIDGTSSDDSSNNL